MVHVNVGLVMVQGWLVVVHDWVSNKLRVVHNGKSWLIVGDGK